MTDEKNKQEDDALVSPEILDDEFMEELDDVLDEVFESPEPPDDSDD